MGSSSRPCQYEGCTRKGAFSFNHLCGIHWQVIIDRNIQKIVDEQKRKKFADPRLFAEPNFAEPDFP